MKRRKFSQERFQYWFDRMMAKGPVSMSVLLLAMTTVVVGVIGIISFFVADGHGLIYQLWMSLMHTLDPGTLAGNATDNPLYLLLMFLATLCGMFLTSILIGIITSGVEGKMRDLRKGNSVVQEVDHTVIIGFDRNVYTLLTELIEANANKKKACIVVLGEQPKEEMVDAIAARIPDTKTTQIICRSGSLHEAYALERCSIATCRSVILNIRSDVEVVKSLLAISSHLKDKKLVHPDLRIVAAVRNRQNAEFATIAGEGRAEIIYTKEAIARIIANTCRQHGLSQVLTELFNFEGNEFYFESVPSLTGKTFHDALLSFSNAIVVGIFTNGTPLLNPPMDTVIGPEDKVILFEEDDGSFVVHPLKVTDSPNIRNSESIVAQSSDHLIVLGSNNKLPFVLTEYNDFVNAGTRIIVIDNDFDPDSLPAYENLIVTNDTRPITRDLLCSYIDQGMDNILLLNDDSLEREPSDSQTLMRLILLRDIADKSGTHLSITTELRSIDNQKLAARARVDDFVIGSNFAGLLMAQVSENPYLITLFREVLDEAGSEFYMKPASDYVTLGVPVDSYVLTESAARKGEVFVGYRKSGPDKGFMIVNPNKEDPITFGPSDHLVVISED